ncbi:hypothetical protein J3R82DRAFT_8971 [Butyriboletus roseoflavus]|nr:hypothetical protein J3R82DRAFT_8971 [Butyriboletus roseoflavus]
MVILTTIYLLNPYQTPLRTDLYEISIRDNELPARLERAERVYSKLVGDRREMIRRFGPTARDISMYANHFYLRFQPNHIPFRFPEDKEPWPPYTVWSFFPPSFACPHELERVGSLGDGGKWTCGLSRLQHKPDCLIYTFGMNYETSFEAEVLERTRYCEVWGYDYRSNSFGSIKRDRRAHFHPWGLANIDAHVCFPSNLSLHHGNPILSADHQYMDILKVDIEGWEFEVLTQILQPYIASGEPVPFGQLLIEIHTWDKKFEDVLSWWEMLESAGLRPFMSEVNLVYQNYNRGSDTALVEYSFINVKGNNIFVADPLPTLPDGSVT